VDPDAQALLDMTLSAPITFEHQFLADVTERVAESARAALDHLQPFTHVGFGKAQVERFASSRRVRLRNGVLGIRLSCPKDPELIAAPEGLIDPWLRTITFFDMNKPRVRLHYYASHPISNYGQGIVSADTPGLARARLEREEGIPQI